MTSHQPSLTKAPKIHQRWQKAALLGSVWASLEIVVGSFLHNMTFPFTGTILSGLGIALLIAGHSLWKEKGIVWRAGLICAVMKSVSPSAVIFGPMIGIAAEAFIVEIAIRMLGANAFGYIIGGAIACTTPIIQKTIAYLFTYGMDVALLFGKLVEFASKSVKTTTLGPADVIAAVIGINLIWGGISGVIGMKVGKRAAIISESGQSKIPRSVQRSNILDDAGIHFSELLLAVHLLVLLFGLVFQSLFFLLYIPFCLYRYQQVRNKFRRWVFWVEIGTVSVLAGIVLGEFVLANRTTGILIGLQMFFRAVFVVSTFTAISVELRNPVILNYLFKRRMKNFSLAIDAAFGALPSIIDSLQQEKTFFRHPIDSLSRILSHTNEIYKQQLPASNVFILSGEKGSGKTSLLLELLPELTVNKISTGGILQLGLWKEGTRYGYDLLNIESGTVVPLCRTDAPDSGITAGPFKFFPEAFRLGRTALSPSAVAKCDVVIIDEIGPLEFGGNGWADSLAEILQCYFGTIIIVVRSSSIDDIIKKFNISPIAIWSTANITAADILNLLIPIHEE
jgi:nucleoside-triphosphatase THEP1